jgi:hypothetical protein
MTGCREAFAAYIGATNTHQFECVRRFVHPDSTYWFGPVYHERVEAIQAAFERAWAAVADEVYEVRDCRWLIETDEHAVVTYRYHWEGVVEGSTRTGGGLGTNVLVASAGGWQMVHEHLTPQPAATHSTTQASGEAAAHATDPCPGAKCQSAPLGPSEA